MSEESTEITTADIKTPKKLTKKLKTIFLTALGGVGQRIFDAMIKSADKEGKIDPFYISVAETLGFAAAGGTLKSKMASNVFAGATAGASADALESGLMKIGINIRDFETSKLSIKKPTLTARTGERVVATIELDDEEDVY